MNQCYVFLPPAACAGAAADLPAQRVQGGRSERLPFAEAVAQVEVGWTLVLPVEAVTACAVRLPTLKARWLRQALPFAVEELLAEDVEQLHLALGEPLADGRHRVFAVRRSWLAGWLALCPVPPQRIVMDADLLPHEGTSLLLLESRWLLGGAGVARLALDAASWPALAEHCPSPRIGYCTAGQAYPAPLDASQSVADGHAWLVRQAAGSNLAQGEFAQIGRCAVRHHVALGDLARADALQRRRLHAQHAAGDGDALGIGFRRNVHHARPARIGKMCQFVHVCLVQSRKSSRPANRHRRGRPGPYSRCCA